MIRRANLVWVLVAVAMGFFLFEMKYAVQRRERDLEQVNERVLRNRESIHVLKAEWSYLNRPERLRELSEKHLHMAPVGPRQIVTFADLPARALGVGPRGKPGDGPPLAALERNPSPTLAQATAERSGFDGDDR